MVQRLLYNAIKEDVVDSEYMNVLADSISSWGTASREAVYIKQTLDKAESSDISGRNSNPNNFPNRRTY
jgi:hypothetical protein